MAKKPKKRKKPISRKKRILKSVLAKLIFAFEILVLAGVIIALHYYGRTTKQMEQIVQPEFHEEKIVVNAQVAESSGLSGFDNYALFGIDHRDQNAALEGENSDTIIICTLNHDTKEIRLVSVYRDTLLNIGDGIYSKANAAYASGGPEQAISMLNKNFDLNIKGYATIDFNALVNAVDDLGGLDIPLSYAEIVHMNNYCVETAQETGKTYTPVELPGPEPDDQEAIVGTYHLNGVQVTSYCRIRYTGNLDMGRTDRQRMVISMLVDKIKSAGISKAIDVLGNIFSMVTTSFTNEQILSMLPSLITYHIGDCSGFPFEYKFSNAKGSVIVPTDLYTNVSNLHAFLFDDANYSPSPDCAEYSQKILDIVANEELSDTSTANGSTDNESVIWTETETGWENTYVAGNDTSTYYNEYNSDSTGSYDSGSGSYDSGSGSYDSGESSYDSGGSSYDSGGSSYDSGESSYDSGSGSYDTGGDTGYDTGGDTGYDTGGGDTGYDTGGGDSGYDTGGGDAGYDTGGGDAGYDTGGGDASYDTGGEDVAAVEASYVESEAVDTVSDTAE